MKVLWSFGLSALTTTYNLSNGQYGLFEIRYAGTAAVGVTVTLANCGNVILNVKGSDIVNVDVDLLSQLADQYGGFIEASSAIGAAFAFSIFYKPGYWYDDNNIFDSSPGDQTYFKLDYPAMTNAVIANGNVTIYGKPRIGVQGYYHKILSHAVVSGGATTSLTDTIQEPNIIALYLKNPTALTSQMQLTKDNKIYADGDTVSELVYSNWIHRLESASTLLAFEFAESGNVQESRSNTLTYKYTTTGAGTLAQYYSAIMFSPEKLAQSANNAKVLLSQK